MPSLRSSAVSILAAQRASGSGATRIMTGEGMLPVAGSTSNWRDFSLRYASSSASSGWMSTIAATAAAVPPAPLGAER